jgi:hypothetical protein
VSQNVLVVVLVILPMLGLACLSVAENLEESGLDGWYSEMISRKTYEKARVQTQNPF